jgi:PIN domain nuclease of toxin-antitoxin system
VILLDAYALVAFLTDEPAADDVDALLRRGDCAVNAVNFSEAVDVSCRVHDLDEGEVRSALDPLRATGQLDVVVASEASAWRAAQIRIDHYDRRLRPLSLADCFLLADSTSEDEIATADPVVAELARDFQIRLVPLPDSAGRLPEPGERL